MKHNGFPTHLAGYVYNIPHAKLIKIVTPRVVGRPLNVASRFFFVLP